MAGKEKLLFVILKWAETGKEGTFLLRNDVKPSILSRTPLSKKKLTKKEKKSDKKKSKSVYMESRDEHSWVETVPNPPYNMHAQQFQHGSYVDPNWNSAPAKTAKKPKGNLRLMGDTHRIPEGAIQIVNKPLNPNIPAKSLLASSSDTAEKLVRLALEKFGGKGDNPKDYCLVRVVQPLIGGSNPHMVENVELEERVLEDNECPMQIAPPTDAWRNNHIQYQLRRRESFKTDQEFEPPSLSRAPVLIELSHTPKNTPSMSKRRFKLSPQSTEIGSNVSLLDPTSYICLAAPGIQPRHCVINANKTQGYSIAPLDKSAFVSVNDHIIKEPTPLPLNATILLGEKEMFQFVIPHHSRSASLLPHHAAYEYYRNDRLGKAYSTEELFPQKVRREREVKL